MKQNKLLTIGVVIALAAGLVWLGRPNYKPEDSMARIGAALQARKVPVVVVTKGKDGPSSEAIRGVQAAIADAERTAFIHVNTLNPVEKEVVGRFAGATLPLIIVLGLDGLPAYQGAAPANAEAIKKGVATGLTRKPVEIPDEAAGEHEHSH